MAISESKSNLARLLSEEQLLVEQRNVPTAYFDGESRLLVLPTLKTDLSNDVTDLMISHEVGHALFTPPKEWVSALESGIKKGILNVVEDARIENLIKIRYPGLKYNYAKGYKELFDMDFFGLSKLDIESLNFVDRINLHCKVGYIKEILFSEKENVLLKKVENTKTFNDVVKLSKEIQDFIKEEYKEKVKEYALNFDGQDAEEENDIGDDFKEIEGESENFDSREGESDDSEFSSDDLDSALSSFFDELDDDLRSFTDEYSQEQLKNLYLNDGKETVYVDVPNINAKRFTVNYKEILLRLRKDVPELFAKKLDRYNKFKVENANVVSYLVKEFTLKKNAQGRKKVRESKTGDINLGKLYSYKFNDDIFKRSVKVPGEKNHSMIFYLDWSGSMDNYFNDTVKQLLCLVMFCKKLNIPYEVYAFTSSYYPENYTTTLVSQNVRYVDDYHINTMYLDDLKLLNLFSYKMSNNEFIEMANILLSYGPYGFEKTDPVDYYDKHICRTPVWFQLGNTPLNHSVILSQKISEEFKEKTKTDILNNIFLTDGESHNIKFKSTKGWQSLSSHFYRVFLRNKKTRVTTRVKSGSPLEETNACVNLVKESTGHRYFGFRLINRYEVKRHSYNFFGEYDYSKIWSILKKENCVETKNTGFDKFYFVRSNLISTDEELNKIEKTESVNSIYKKYDKSISSKLNNRIFIKKFIEFIS